MWITFLKRMESESCGALFRYPLQLSLKSDKLINVESPLKDAIKILVELGIML